MNALLMKLYNNLKNEKYIDLLKNPNEIITILKDDSLFNYYIKFFEPENNNSKLFFNNVSNNTRKLFLSRSLLSFTAIEDIGILLTFPILSQLYDKIALKEFSCLLFSDTNKEELNRFIISWSSYLINFDILYILNNIETQSELINLISEEISSFLDKDVLDKICTYNDKQTEFCKTVPNDFMWGEKQYVCKELGSIIEKFSCDIVKSSLLEFPNIILINPVNLFMLMNVGNFNIKELSIKDCKYRVAELIFNKIVYKIICFSEVPIEDIILLVFNEKESKSSFIYDINVPIIPEINKNGMQILSRINTKCIQDSIRIIKIKE